MNAEKKVFSRLFTEEKTELATQKIELGAIDDLDSRWKGITTDYGQVNSLVRKANSLLEDMEKRYNSLEGDAVKVGSKLKELGVDSKEYDDVLRKLTRDKREVRNTLKRSISSF